MREMKDSGIEWIGEIPANWNKKKIKYTLTQRIKKNSPIICKNILSLTAKQGVIPYSEKEGAGGNKPKEDYSSYNLAYPNDIVMNSMNVISGSVGLSKYFGCVSPVYYMFYSKTNDIRFFNYIFQTSVFQRNLYGLGNGILIKESDNGKFNTVRMRIPMDKLGLEFLPICSLSEQRKIADFLDQKCSEIDALTADIQTQIETLEEYKKSVITEAVTKGLDPNVEMKDSGVEWIGKIPEKWAVIKLKYSSFLKGRIGWQGLRTDEFIEDEHKPYLITGTDFDNGYINWNTCVHISEERYMQDLAIHIKENDLLITKDGTIGKVAVAKNCPKKVTLNSGVFIIRNTKNFKYNDRYMYYLLKSQQFCKWFELSNSGNSTIKHLNQEKFYNFVFTYPVITEQIRIADFLDQKCSEIDQTISEKQKQLETLADYKKSLIYECVTGKREIA